MWAPCSTLMFIVRRTLARLSACASDIGRPLSDIAALADAKELGKYCAQVIADDVAIKIMSFKANGQRLNWLDPSRPPLPTPIHTWGISPNPTPAPGTLVELWAVDVRGRSQYLAYRVKNWP